MQDNAIALFLAESTALALQGAMDATELVASSLNKRHKVRQADLIAIYNKAKLAKENTYERAIYVITLLLYAGAAYKDPSNLLSGELDNRKVLSHHDPEKLQLLRTTYLWEPMNLFAGFASENQSVGQQTFDLHSIYRLNDGTIFTATEPSSQKEGKAGDNHSIARRFAPAAFAHFAPIASGNIPQANPMVRPALQRTLTPTSEVLDFNRSLVSTICQPNVDMTEWSKIAELISQLSQLESKLTAAGERHYTELVHSLQARYARGDAPAIMVAAYKTIAAAKGAWTTHRAELRTWIDVLKVHCKNQLCGEAEAYAGRIAEADKRQRARALYDSLLLSKWNGLEAVACANGYLTYYAANYVAQFMKSYRASADTHDVALLTAKDAASKANSDFSQSMVLRRDLWIWPA